jgi:hypothetical protein
VPCRRLTIGAGVIALVTLAWYRWPGAAQGGPDIFEVFGPALRPEFVSDLDPLYRPMYEMSVTLDADDEAARFSGTLAVQVSNTSEDAWESVVFRLYPNLESYGGQMTVDRVAVEGTPVTPELDSTGTVLEVPLPEAAAPGETFHLTLAFETTLTAGVEALYNQFSYLNGCAGRAGLLPDSERLRGRRGRWWRETVHPGGDAIYSETSALHRAPDRAGGLRPGDQRRDPGADPRRGWHGRLRNHRAPDARVRPDGQRRLPRGKHHGRRVTVNAYSYEADRPHRLAGMNLAVDP